MQDGCLNQASSQERNERSSSEKAHRVRAFVPKQEADVDSQREPLVSHAHEERTSRKSPGLPKYSTNTATPQETNLMHPFDAPQPEKQIKMSELESKLAGRDEVIVALEDTVRMQVNTIHELMSRLDDMSQKMAHLKTEHEKRGELFKMQNERLRDNSVTISGMLRTISSQNKTMAELRSDVQRLRSRTESNSGEQCPKQTSTADKAKEPPEPNNARSKEADISEKARAA